VGERYILRMIVYYRVNRRRKAGVWDRIMNPITADCDGEVQMIDAPAPGYKVQPCRGSLASLLKWQLRTNLDTISSAGDSEIAT
jgi:hypothetical protein